MWLHFILDSLRLNIQSINTNLCELKLLVVNLEMLPGLYLKYRVKSKIQLKKYLVFLIGLRLLSARLFLHLAFTCLQCDVALLWTEIPTLLRQGRFFNEDAKNCYNMNSQFLLFVLLPLSCNSIASWLECLRHIIGPLVDKSFNLSEQPNLKSIYKIYNL